MHILHVHSTLKTMVFRVETCSSLMCKDIIALFAFVSLLYCLHLSVPWVCLSNSFSLNLCFSLFFFSSLSSLFIFWAISALFLSVFCILFLSFFHVSVSLSMLSFLCFIVFHCVGVFFCGPALFLHPLASKWSGLLELGFRWHYFMFFLLYRLYYFQLDWIFSWLDFTVFVNWSYANVDAHFSDWDEFL